MHLSISWALLLVLIPHSCSFTPFSTLYWSQYLTINKSGKPHTQDHQKRGERKNNFIEGFLLSATFHQYFCGWFCSGAVTSRRKVCHAMVSAAGAGDIATTVLVWLHLPAVLCRRHGSCPNAFSHGKKKLDDLLPLSWGAGRNFLGLYTYWYPCLKMPVGMFRKSCLNHCMYLNWLSSL